MFPALYWAWVDRNVAEGRKLREDLVTLYKHRGKMVHEGISAVTTEQLDRLQFGMVMGFFLFTDLLMNLKIGSSAELRDWYLQHKAILDDDRTDQPPG